MKRLKVTFIKPSLIGHSKRGTGVYLDNLFEELNKRSDVSCKITNFANIPKNSDIIHFPYFDPFFLTLPFFKNLPTIVTVHDVIPLLFPSKFPRGIRGTIKWNIQKKSLQQKDAIITDAVNSQVDIVNVARISKSKIYPIHLGIDTNFKQIKDSKLLDGVKKKFNLPEQFVLYVGDINWNKNIKRLVNAIKEINLSLVLVSSTLKNSTVDFSHPSNKSLSKLDNLIRNDKRFFVIGDISKENLVMLYSLATVFIFPSLYEGFGLPVVEAFACGCPVVCSDKGSLKEVVNDAALIVDPYDVNDIANGIGEIFFNTSVQKKYIEKGLKRTKAFSWKKTADETVSVYKKNLEIK